MERRKVLFTFLGILVLASVVAPLSRMPLTPTKPEQLARMFIDLLIKEDYAGAFELTAKSGEVGGTLEAFTKQARQQFRIAGPRDGIRVGLTSVHPPQTLGNRLRRWVMGQEVEQSRLSTDFVLSRSAELLLLFEVRFDHSGDDVWKVSFFQSHAG